MKKKTSKQIESEIKKLESLKTRVPPRTVFGEDNLAAIDASIKVLRENMTEDDAYSIQDDRLRDNALQAIMWRNGEQELLADDPEGWLSICK